MSFTFGFPDPCREENDSNKNNSIAESLSETTVISSKSSDATNDNCVHVEKCQEIFLDNSLVSDIPNIQYQVDDSLSIKCLDCQKVTDHLTRNSQMQDSSLAMAVRAHSDLIPNVYEGGLKVWECSVDLVRYLYTSHVDFTGARVLELGCGAGLPGLLAALRGATDIHFQDYNKEVLVNYTVHNVSLNWADHRLSAKVRYFSGDWDSFRETVCTCDGHIAYDFILTAETIYQPENYRKLYRIFQQCLSKEGEIYVAAKSNYFGVGGGTKDFEDFLQKEGGFTVEICHSVSTGQYGSSNHSSSGMTIDPEQKTIDNSLLFWVNSHSLGRIV